MKKKTVGKVVISRNEENRWTWEVLSKNGRVLYAAPKTFISKQMCLKSLDVLKEIVKSGIVEERE